MDILPHAVVAEFDRMLVIDQVIGRETGLRCGKGNDFLQGAVRNRIHDGFPFGGFAVFININIFFAESLKSRKTQPVLQGKVPDRFVLVARINARFQCVLMLDIYFVEDRFPADTHDPSGMETVEIRLRSKIQFALWIEKIGEIAFQHIVVNIGVPVECLGPFGHPKGVAVIAVNGRKIGK